MPGRRLHRCGPGSRRHPARRPYRPWPRNHSLSCLPRQQCCRCLHRLLLHCRRRHRQQLSVSSPLWVLDALTLPFQLLHPPDTGTAVKGQPSLGLSSAQTLSTCSPCFILSLCSTSGQASQLRCSSCRAGKGALQQRRCFLSSGAFRRCCCGVGQLFRHVLWLRSVPTQPAQHPISTTPPAAGQLTLRRQQCARRCAGCSHRCSLPLLLQRRGARQLHCSSGG